MKTSGMTVNTVTSPEMNGSGGPEPSRSEVSAERDGRLLVGQCQVVMNRISLREGSDVHPLSAAFYLHEEFGRLDNGLETHRADDVALALVNLYVASVWLADQYGVGLKQGYQSTGLEVALDQVVETRSSRRAERCLADEISRARKSFLELAQNIGLYEIGYASDRTEGVRSLIYVIPEFHTALVDLADRFEIDMCQGVRGAFRGNPLDRLSSAGYNPLNVSAVRDFSAIRDNTYCPFAPAARLWGARDFDRGISLRENLVRSLDPLLSFTRAARWERLDGFVFSFPADLFGRNMDQLSVLLKTVLGFLSEHDPDNPRTLEREQVIASDWRFRFFGEDFFVPVFSPLYSHGHSRHTYDVQDTVFILMQPDSSFHFRMGDNKQQTRSQIKRRFMEGMQSYDTSELIEAHRFLLPTGEHDEPVRWYDADL